MDHAKVEQNSQARYEVLRSVIVTPEERKRDYYRRKEQWKKAI